MSPAKLTEKYTSNLDTKSIDTHITGHIETSVRTSQIEKMSERSYLSK